MPRILGSVNISSDSEEEDRGDGTDNIVDDVEDDTAHKSTGDESDIVEEEAKTAKSWVWAHFKKSDDGKKTICQVNRCSEKMKKFSGSTSAMNYHLNSIHDIYDPGLTDAEYVSFIHSFILSIGSIIYLSFVRTYTGFWLKRRRKEIDIVEVGNVNLLRRVVWRISKVESLHNNQLLQLNRWPWQQPMPCFWMDEA